MLHVISGTFNHLGDALPIRFIKNFIHLEAAGGIILFISALIAITIDNSALSHYYEYIIELPLSIQLGDITVSKFLIDWVNDGLMVIFFLLVGLEIKREILEGELNSLSKVILPAAAAIGGMAVPAIVFTLFNMGHDYSMRGWAIPTATDIAFSLGILSLLGSRVPASLKVFLMALAIFDDLGAIIIIAIFYSSNISYGALGIAFLCVFALVALNRQGIKNLVPYFLVAFALWVSLLYSGVHATLSGVALALAIPLSAKTSDGLTISPLKDLVKKLHPWVAYFILPIFALFNAGVSFADVPPGIANIFSPVMLGICLGLVVGKMIGVFTTTFLAIKLGLASMPTNSTWAQIAGIALVCGVGFTMSFFVGTLAYPSGHATEPYDAWVRMGVLAGSVTSGTLGYIVLRLTTRR